MPEPILVPFHVQHLAGLVNRDDRHGDIMLLAHERENGLAVTALHDGHVLGCAGIVIPWPGMGTAWMILSPDITTHRCWLTHTVKRALRDWIRIFCLHRVEAVALQESPTNQQWIEALGFQRERDGCARAYTSDRRTVVRYERIEEA